MGHRSRHVPGHEEEFHIGYEGKKPTGMRGKTGREERRGHELNFVCTRQENRDNMGEMAMGTALTKNTNT